jgi:hypothetical protein
MSTIKIYVLLFIFVLIGAIFFILGQLADMPSESDSGDIIAENEVSQPFDGVSLPAPQPQDVYGRIDQVPADPNTLSNTGELGQTPINTGADENDTVQDPLVTNSEWNTLTSQPTSPGTPRLQPPVANAPNLNPPTLEAPSETQSTNIVRFPTASLAPVAPTTTRSPSSQPTIENATAPPVPQTEQRDQRGGLTIDLAPIRTAQKQPAPVAPQQPIAVRGPDSPQPVTRTLSAPRLSGPNLSAPTTPSTTTDNVAPVENPTDRLGPVFKSPLVPVAPLDNTQPSNAATIDDETLIIHGSGAVKMGVPGDWHVAEVHFGREIRLVLTVTPQLDKKSMPLDGIWITYHVRSVSAPRTLAELASLVPGRLQLATGRNVQFAQPKPIEIDGNKGFVVDFSMQQFDKAAAGDFTGRHLMVQTKWGVCEIHMKAPTKVFAERDQLFAEAVLAIKFGTPSPPDSAIIPNTVAAKTIIGTWKALRSQMKLHGDGRIVIITDRPELLTANNQRRQQQDAEKPLKLTGKYEAHNDLLIVRWDDGSKLNFRWTLRNEDLLLTDHEGQISLLRKVLD